MAKNRVAPDRNHKTKDNFFKKTQSKFRNNKPQQKNRNDKESQQTSSTNSDTFFVKSDSATTSTGLETSKVHNLRGNRQHEAVEKPEKKPFDKKKYRLQKYSKKYKLQQWEDKRKKSVLRGYYKSLKEDEIHPAKKIYEEENKIDETNTDNEDSNKTDDKNENEKQDTAKEELPRNSKERKNKSFRKAQQEFQRIKEEKQRKKELLLKQKAEKEEALEAYKKKKVEKFKKLNKKNKKGQPIMKGRIEMLLEKIQNSIKQE